MYAGKGLMIGVEFVEDRTTKEPAKHLCDRVVDLAFERGSADARLRQERDPRRTRFEHQQV